MKNGCMFVVSHSVYVSCCWCMLNCSWICVSCCLTGRLISWNIYLCIMLSVYQIVQAAEMLPKIWANQQCCSNGICSEILKFEICSLNWAEKVHCLTCESRAELKRFIELINDAHFSPKSFLRSSCILDLKRRVKPFLICHYLAEHQDGTAILVHTQNMITLNLSL